MSSLRARAVPLVALVVVVVVAASLFAWRLLADAVPDGDPELRAVATRPANGPEDDLVPASRRERDEVAASDVPSAAVPDSASSSIAPPSESQAGLEDMRAQPDASYMLALHVVDVYEVDVAYAEVSVWDDEAAYRADPATPPSSWRVDAFGRAAIHVPSREAVLLASSFDGRDSGWIRVAALAADGENDVVLCDPICCLGRVLEADGRPAPGCTVEIEVSGDAQPHFVEPVLSDRDGAFVVTYCGGEARVVRLWAVRGDERSSSRADRAWSCDRDLAGRIELTMPASIFRIEGVALDGLGQCVPGVHVAATWRSKSASAVSDVAGRFVLVLDEPERYRLSVDPANAVDPAWMLARPVDVELDAAHRTAEVVVPVVKAISLRGRVAGRSSSFDPSSLVVRAEPSRAFGKQGGLQTGVDVETFLDSDGFFALFPVHPDVDYDLVLRERRGARLLELLDVPGSSPQLLLVVDDVPLPSLVGKVTRACDPALPEPGARLRLFTGVLPGWSESPAVAVDADGTFAIDLTARDRSGGDRLQQWFVLIEADGFAPATIGPGDPRAWRLPLDVRLRAQAELVVEVVDVEGRPVDGGVVSRPYEFPSRRDGPLDVLGRGANSSTIEDGTARLDTRASWPDVLAVRTATHPQRVVRVPAPDGCREVPLRVVVGEPMEPVDTTLVFRGSRGEVLAGARVELWSSGDKKTRSIELDADGSVHARLVPGVQVATLTIGAEMRPSRCFVPPEGGELVIVVD